MDLDERTYQLIEQYLNGELKGQALIDFEKRIESIPQLKEEININKQLLAHFNGGHIIGKPNSDLEKIYESKEVNEFKDKLNTTLGEYKNQNPIIKKETAVRKLSWKPIAVAASVLLLIGVFYFNNINSNTTSAGELFADNFRQETLSLTTKGNGVATISSIEQSYNNKDFEAAESLLSSALIDLEETDPFWFDLKLSHGISLLELNRNKEAEDVFNTLRKSDSMDAPKGDWYYILTLLKKSEKEKALKEIDIYLEKENSYKTNELKEIKNQLE